MFEDYFYYDETSPTGLRWKVKARNSLSGDPAGTRRNSKANVKYYKVGLDKKYYPAQYIIWSLHKKLIPERMIIDHVDGNGKNNCITNLRVVPQSSNVKNCKKNKRNTSGISGISFDYVNNGSTKLVVAQVGKQRKRFSTAKYGEKEAILLAVQWRNMKLVEDGEYTSRHGL